MQTRQQTSSLGISKELLVEESADAVWLAHGSTRKTRVNTCEDMDEPLMHCGHIIPLLSINGQNHCWIVLSDFLHMHRQVDPAQSSPIGRCC